MRAILALDQGTTSSRAILFGLDGERLAIAQRPLAQHYPQPGWVEHDPRQIWADTEACALEVLTARPDVEVLAIGIANQRETAVLWDRRTGEPLAPAIVWQDRRTAARCAELRPHEDAVRRTTGLVLDPYFSAAKIAWLLDEYDLRDRPDIAFGTVDAWLVFRMTGAHRTDATNASRTSLLDLQTLHWSKDLAELFRVPMQLLPEVVPSAGIVGRWRGIPVAGIAGDQHAATFGQACLRPGMAKNTYGTGCFLLANVGSAPVEAPPGLLSTVAYALPEAPTYAIEGSVFVAGAAIQWLAEELGIVRDAAEAEALAGSVADSGGVALVPAFAGLGAPYWDADARGALVGLTRGSGRAQIARAAFESIAFQTADLVSLLPVEELRVDGGGARSDLLMQLQADVLGLPVVRPRETETTALGAALLAGLGAGVFADAQEAAQVWRAERTFEPQWSADRRESALAGWHGAVRRARSVV